MKGKIVIGEGELDEAPMLFINEEVGTKNGEEWIDQQLQSILFQKKIIPHIYISDENSKDDTLSILHI